MNLKNLIIKLRHPGAIIAPLNWSNKVLIKELRARGGVVGDGTRFISPSQCSIDFGRADYISIGSNCCLSHVHLIAHDYSWYTLLDSCGDILPDPGGKIVIGNNCFIGFQSVILKNTEIGDNVIIGAKSLVKGKIPSNTVWAGVPARQICTIKEMYQKKYENRISDAKMRRDHIINKYGRNPSIEEMGLFSMLFLQRTEENYQKYIKNIEFNGIKDAPQVRSFFFNCRPTYTSFEEFLNID